ncbi:glycosyltransferase family 4 protein [Halobaculum marinum]|uniref:Glycosyltransferase family 4 protein n=1 Tax=Halobaculum marinum TaxID=3031996 RepID=A0ABD5WQK9_9EURY|nr:glycosyltransferase family 4 protein [Halobaculum sp. DT55]
MQVLYIIGQGEGGLAHYTAELANAVAVDHDVVVMKPEETDADAHLDDRVQVVEAFSPIQISMPRIYSLDMNPITVLRGLYSYTAIERVFDIDPDVVHDATGIFPQVRLFAARHGVDETYPFVVTKHEVLESRFSLSRPPVMVEEAINLLLPSLDTDAYVVHTPSQRDALVRQGVDSDRVSVIPHGAYSLFGSADDVSRSPEPNTLLFFGNVVPPKGVDTLVEAMPLVREHVPDATLVIAGSGSLPEDARAIVDAHPDAIEYLDRYVPDDEVGDLFARAEVVVTPYREQGGTKGHSGALSTAFSFGKPVVSSSAGDFPRLVGETGCGRVVPPEDPERLADALVDVLTDDEARAEMARRSREMAERLSWSTIADEHVDLYERVVGSVDVGRNRPPDGESTARVLASEFDI